MSLQRLLIVDEFGKFAAMAARMWRRSKGTDPARFLGYDKPEGFRRARTGTPIPGEGKLPDGRPYWPLHALRDWHSGRIIAGNRGGGPSP